MDEQSYQKLSLRPTVSRQPDQQPEKKYWRRFTTPVTTQQIGIPTHISFSPVAPHDYAVTSSTRVLVYDGRSHALKKTISRFPDTAYNASFRSDGQLLVAGCENGHVLVFPVNSRAILRKFTHHKRPTHATSFTPTKTHVLSGSDDATLRLWDLSAGQQVSMFLGHTDYVRSAACISEHAFLSGSYDHTVRLWDTRAKTAQLTLDHGCIVECIARFTNGRIAASAGGTTVRLWDLTAGRALESIGDHQKTVTCASVVDVRDRDGALCSRLLTGALDGHVKVYDLETFTVAYAYKYPAGVMAVAVAPDLSGMVVGMADRTMAVRRHKLGDDAISAIRTGQVRLPKKQRRYAPRLTAASYRYFERGKGSKPSAADVVVQARRRVHLKPYDTLLKQFKYADALHAAVETNSIRVVLSMVDELAGRGGLRGAISCRSATAWLPLLRVLAKHVASPHFTRPALSVVNLLIDEHAAVLRGEPDALRMLQGLRRRLIAEAKVQSDLQSMGGVIDMILNA
eukprot:jgi/Ulvmu1/4685/UM002_0416.1